MANPYAVAGRKYYNRKSRREEQWTWGGSTESKSDITPKEDLNLILSDARILQQAINRQRQDKEAEKAGISLAAMETAKAKTETPDTMAEAGGAPEQVATEAPKYGSIWERIGDAFEANSPQDQYKRQRNRDLAAKLVATGKIDRPENVDIPKYDEEKQKQALAKAEDLKSAQAVNPEGLVASVVTWADAFSTDPATAFEEMLKGYRVVRTNNGALIIERMDVKDSQKVKRDRGGDTTELKLDHIVPLQLGGNNDLDNLKLVPTAEWKKYTGIENLLGSALRREKVDKETAQKLITGYKQGVFIDEDIKLHVSGQGNAFDNYRKRLQAYKATGIAQLRQLYKAGRLPEDAFKAGIVSISSLGDETNIEDLYDPGNARNIVGQAVGPASGAFASQILGLPGNIASLLGTGLEAFTPLDEQGKALQRAGETSGEAFNLFDTLTQASRPGENRALTNISAGAGSLASSLVLGPTKAGVAFGVSAGGQQVRSAKKAGKSPWQAFTAGTVGGIAEGSLEKLGVEKYLGIKGGKAKQILKGFVTEGTQETLQSLAQSGVSQTYKDVDWSDAIGNALLEGGLGGIVGGGGRFAFSVAENLKKQGVDEDTAIKVGLDVQDKLEGSIQKIQKPGDQVSVPQKYFEVKNDNQPVKYFETEQEAKNYTKDLTGATTISEKDSQDAVQVIRKNKLSEFPFEKPEVKPTLQQGSEDKSQLKDTYIQTLGAQLEGTQAEGGTDIYERANFTQKTVSPDTLQVKDISDNQRVSEWEEKIKAGARPEVLTRTDKGEVTVADGSHKLQAYKNLGIEVPTIDAEINTKPEDQKKDIMSPELEEKHRQARQSSDNIETLKAEAGKYKSAEEFVKAQQQASMDRFYGEDGDQKFMATLVDKYKGKVDDKKSIEDLMTPAERTRYNAIKAQPELDIKQLTDIYNQATSKSKVTKPPQKTSKEQVTKTRKYKTIHQGDKIKTVEGEPVQLIDNVDTFIHKGTGGWVVSESTTGRYLGTSKTKKGAVADAKANIDKVGLSKFKKALKDKQLSKDFKPVNEPTQKTSEKPEAKKQSSSRSDALEAVGDYQTGNRKIDASPENLKKLADQLNKAAQSSAILRRGQYRSKKNLGVFQRPTKGGKGERIVKLQDAVIKDPSQYPVVLAHELSHAIEYNITGSTRKTYEVFGELTKKEKAQIEGELKEIVNNIEGQGVAESKPEYFYKPTEMLARYVETLVMEPGKVYTIAPLTSEKFDDLVATNPMVGELMMAIQDKLDQGWKDRTPDVFKDMRQIYRKQLGKTAGDKAYGSELIRRAEIGRAQKMIEKLMKTKFKNVKDNPETLFRAAEGIRITRDGKPEFGTHKYKYLAIKDQKAIEKLKDEGWEDVGVASETHEGKSEDEIILRKARYTPEQAKAYFEELSPEGQQLIKDFTAAKEEARDDFNRELLKAVYKIDTNLEGWVHHYFEGGPFTSNPNVSLKRKVAAAKKQRTEAEGYVEDFKKAMTKALSELETKEINNKFISDQLARISKPIAQGQRPDPGWVEIVADEKGGLRLPGEGTQVLIQQNENKKAVRVPQKRYQVPRELAEHYREIRDLPAEMNKVSKTLDRIGKYWGLNVLVHPGTSATNFLSGGAQYGLKVLDDFYTDLLTADFAFSKTRKDLIAPIKVLTPKGWNNAPDWMYGGYRSTFAGQFASGNYMTDSKVDRSIEKYGNNALKVFSMVEAYWKKVIALSEDSKLSETQKRSMFKRLNSEEKKIITELNKPIDLYALDYDNTPLWLRNFDNKGGKLFKPFMKYPYKYTKLITDHVSAPFDKSLPWQVRTAKIMALGTLVAMINQWYNDREDEQETPMGTEDTPYPLRPRGRVFIGMDKLGDELFVRTAKYPFLNLTSLGRSIVQGNFDQTTDLLREQFGTLGPGAELAMLAIGQKSEFDQYTPTSALLGNQLATYVPGFRILNDIGRIMDPNKRTPKNFVQGFFSSMPVWGSDETRAKLRGDKKTIKIPDEPPEGRSMSKTARTVTEKDRLENKTDVLIALLTGVYISRINPMDAKKQELREIRDAAETTIRDLLKQGNEADAQAMASEYGFTIPEGTLDYYRRGADEQSSFRNEDIKKQLASLNLSDYAESIGTTPSHSATPRLARLKTLAAARNKYGWDDQQLASLDRLIQNESGWRATADNPTSSAWGLFQFLDMHKRPGGYLPKGNDSSLEDQIAGGLKYIKDRYGTPSNAFASWLSRYPHYY